MQPHFPLMQVCPAREQVPLGQEDEQAPHAPPEQTPFWQVPEVQVPLGHVEEQGDVDVHPVDGIQQPVLLGSAT